MALFKSAKFNFLAPPRVIIEGEPGINAGGLRREYGCLLRKVIFSPEVNFFEGQEDRKLPIYYVDGPCSRLFQLIAKVTAYLIIHLDWGVPCLSPAVYKYIVTSSRGMQH